SITPLPDAPCVCIAVSHPSCLYLTQDGILTHNTTVAPPSFAEEMRASGRNPDKLPPETLTTMESARHGDRQAFTALAPLQKKAVVAAVVRAQDGPAADALGIDRAEFAHRDLFSLPDTTSDLPPLTPEAVTTHLATRSAAGIAVLNDPSLPWEGRLTPEGRIELNAALLTTPADVDRVFDHEVAHLAERDPANAADFAALRSALPAPFLAALETDLRGRGYGTAALPAEVAANLAQSLHARFQQSPAWQRLLQRLITWAKERLGLTLNDHDAQVIAARLIARGLTMAPAAGSAAFSLPAAARTQRLPSLTDEIQAGWNLTKANQEERTIDGQPVEPVAYRVRSNAELLQQGHRWLDQFQDHHLDTPTDETGPLLTAALKNGTDPLTGQPITADVAAVLLIALHDRLPDFGLSRGQWDAARQHNASQLGFGLQAHRAIYDPLGEMIESATQQTATVYTGATGGNIDADFTGLQEKVIAGQQAALAEAAAAISNLTDLFDDAVTKQDTIAADAREAGRKLGERSGRNKGRTEAVQNFRDWLKGSPLPGLPPFLTVARRYLQLSRFNADQFTYALTKLFPTIPPAEFATAAARIAELIAHKTAAARRREIQSFIDALAGKEQAKPHGEKLGKFLHTLLRAEKFGVLDQDTFLAAFAHAFQLNGLTAANTAQLRELWHAIQARDAEGNPVNFGMVRETLERQFATAVNAIAPAARWDNLVFDQYQSGILSSVGSIINQFSGVFRVFAGLDAVQKSVAKRDAGAFLSEWWKRSLDVLTNLPLMLTAIRGESLGHLPPEVRGGFAPREQKLQLAKAGQTMRVALPNGTVISLGDTTRKALRAKELFAWRLIRGAEGVSGISDASAHYRTALAAHYRAAGLKPAAARLQAVADLVASPAERAAAMAQATKEQASGLIGVGAAGLKRRTQEIVQNGIDRRLGEDLTKRVEQLTSYQQFKTPPLGPIGGLISDIFGKLSKPEGATRVTRFFFLFGRFLGHSVDITLGYTPVAHLLTMSGDGTNQRQKAIKEVFGTVEDYNLNQHAKAAAGGAFMLATGLLMAMAQAMADDDEEPFFSISGTAPMADRGAQDKLIASGKWQPGVVKVGGIPINYAQIPELAPILTLLGNASDYALHGETLYPAKGKGVLPAGTAVFANTADVLAAPIKRSTYRQWLEAATALTKTSGGGADKAAEAFANLLTAPAGGFLRVPIVVDADKLFRAGVAKDAEGFQENLMRRIPFVHVGETMMNAYGEEQAGFGLISLLPGNRKASPEVMAAATLNVETNTSRQFPQDPDMKEADGTLIEVTREMREKFVRESGRVYVESLLRNEEDIRRAFEQGGAAAAQKIVSNISTKANKEAKSGLGVTSSQ
ncbi:MAG: hypothetical protein V4675_20015, partial [Verrucomicrobiota bacterium]